MVLLHAPALHRPPERPGSGTSTSARRTASTSAPGVYWVKVKPVPFPLGPASSTVSFSPPVARTTGMRAVAKAVQLVEAARLEPRRHQEHVRSGLDEMRQPLVEPDRGRHAAGLPRRQPAPKLLVASLAAPEHHPGGIERHQLVDAGSDEVEALLIGEPRHETDQRTNRSARVAMQCRPPRGARAWRPVCRSDRRPRTTPARTRRARGSSASCRCR